MYKRQYLNKILSAVYGKDVRQSIYDSINAINTQVEGYVSAEKSRVTAEANRNSAEKIRVSNENDRDCLLYTSGNVNLI